MTSADNFELPVYEYIAAGGVVLNKNKVLVLDRPSRQEFRLPKGHVEAGEELAEAAIREVGEESGYTHLAILADLGLQHIEFDYDGRHIIRQEYFFLMTLKEDLKTSGEAEFVPQWLTAEDALEKLSFQIEKEWVRRALHIVENEC